MDMEQFFALFQIAFLHALQDSDMVGSEIPPSMHAVFHT